MAFDSTSYRNTVLAPLARDNPGLEVLRRVIRDIQGTDGVSAVARLDTARLYAIDPAMTGQELTGHLKALEAAYNKGKSLPSAQLLKKLLGLLGKAGQPVTDPGFWAALAAARAAALRGELSEFAQVMAQEYPLKVVLPEELRERAEGAGLAGLSDGELADALAKQGIEVRPDFDIPKVGVPPAVRKATEYPEFRTIVDVILRPEVPAGIAVVDELAWGDPPRILALDAVSRAQRTLEEQEARVEAGARQQAQYALAALKADCTTSAALHDLVLAAVAELAERLIQRRMPKVSARDELVKRGLRPLDAARIVTKLSASTQLRGLSDVADRLADGALGEARRLLDSLPPFDGDEERERLALAASVAAAERRKAESVRRYDQALKDRDYQAAGAALREALAVDREDEDLARRLARLPPLPPANVSLRVDERVLEVTWSSDPDPAVRYTVVRTGGAVPVNSRNGDVLAGDLDVARYRDPSPPIGRQVRYSVFATRDGVSHSDPVGATVLVLPAPSDLSATPGTTDVALSWTTPPECAEVTVTQIAPDGTQVVHPPTRAGRLSATGLATGIRYRFSAKARYILESGERRDSAAVIIDATPRGGITPVEDLRVEKSAKGSRATWRTVVGYPVELWVLPVTADVPPGGRIAFSDLAQRQGRRLTGHTEDHRLSGRTGHDLADFSGMCLLVPVTVDGEGGLIGATCVVGSAPPAGKPTAERFGDEIRVSWDWPRGDYSIEVGWRANGRRSTRRVSRAAYNDVGGVRISGADLVSDITLETVIRAGVQEWLSPPVPVPLTGAAPVVKYALTLRRARFGGRGTATLVAESTGFRGVLSAVVIVKEAKIMPSGPADGRVVDRPVLDFSTDEPVALEIDLGRVSSPFWVRLFQDAPGAFRIEDPPTNQMRG